MSHRRLRARADRIKQEVDLGELLQEWGYAVVPDPHREQQFSCDLHGPDHKPSARYYGATNSTYCWVCQKKRDPIAWVMEKENLSFRQAIEFLETKAALDPLPWDLEDLPLSPEQEITTISQGEAQTYADKQKRLRKFLKTMTAERDLNAQALLVFWEVFDRISYGVAKQNWGEQKGLAALTKLRGRILEHLKDA